MSIDDKLIGKFKNWMTSDLNKAFEFIDEVVEEIGDPYELINKKKRLLGPTESALETVSSHLQNLLQK